MNTDFTKFKITLFTSSIVSMILIPVRGGGVILLFGKSGKATRLLRGFVYMFICLNVQFGVY